MIKQFKLSRWVSPAVFSLCVAACGDDGSDGNGDVDASDDAQNDAGLDSGADNPSPEAGTDSTSTSAGSAPSGSGSSSSGAGSTLGDASTGSPTDASADASAPADGGDDTATTNNPSDPTDASTTTPGNTSVTDDSAQSLDTDESAETDSGTSTGTGASSDLDAGIEAVPDASGIEDPTSEDVPDPVGPYWEQAFWQGHVEPIGDTTVVAVNGDQLCFSGDESGTVGFWYNVNQAQGGSVEEFSPLDDVAGFNLDIATAGQYEIHFYSDDVLYCSGLIGQDTTFFLWDSFRECDDLLAFFDGETPLTTVRFTYDADGEFEICLNRFESGREPDASVGPVGDGSVDSVDDASVDDASVGTVSDASADSETDAASGNDASVDGSVL